MIYTRYTDYINIYVIMSTDKFLFFRILLFLKLSNVIGRPLLSSSFPFSPVNLNLWGWQDETESSCWRETAQPLVHRCGKNLDLKMHGQRVTMCWGQNQRKMSTAKRGTHLNIFQQPCHPWGALQIDRTLKVKTVWYNQVKHTTGMLHYRTDMPG